MKILIIEHLFPLPADSGGKIKSLCTVRALASEHNVRLLAYVRNEAELAEVDRLREMCEVDVVPFKRSRAANLRHAASSMLRRRSFIVTRDFSREMQQRFDEVVREFEPDVVHIDHLQMARFVDFDGAYRTVLDQHNVESMIVKRIAATASNPLMRAYARIEWPKLLRYELDVCRKADLVLTVSDEDAATLRRLTSPGPSFARRGETPASPLAKGGLRGVTIETVPIGIDVASTPVVERVPGSRNILFLGTMYWPPNIDCVLYFHDEILPIVREEIPGVTFTIAGRRPPKSIERLASHPGVRVAGYVSDAREPAARCGVFVVPLRSGSGVRVKILNAMAMGLPVVSTTIGAEGLGAVHGEHLLIADTPVEFAREVVDVLNDQSLGDSLGRKGRELVEREYSWDVVGRRLLSLYRERLATRHSERGEESGRGSSPRSE